ncbi:N-acetyltransferase [Carboxylicivirga sp. A043]|uniref:arsinothricin resistance N-acetyltransferase ArsN1 family B n=1 Tax=Carboxylicivirga litoralis TaxID=2816963 RepID=UPI0021CB4CDD|nr:arsinothricin resistance N-acetyltransferase ArsN1 family B [Carboxylicivirga sp. A043]MCU4155961.1 N-acetyltransferase [Carboxylicivirga sp. A043]
MIRLVQMEDAPVIAAIYNHYISHSISTFELEPIEMAEMARRIKSISRQYPYFVYEEDNQLLGYAYASEWKSRKAYLQTVESSIYLHPEAQGKGIGTMLYTRLIDELKTLNIHAVIGGISLPNEASIALHEKLGFEKIGQFKEVGRKFDKWVDVGYWELVL